MRNDHFIMIMVLLSCKSGIQSSSNFRPTSSVLTQFLPILYKRWSLTGNKKANARKKIYVQDKRVQRRKTFVPSKFLTFFPQCNDQIINKSNGQALHLTFDNWSKVLYFSCSCIFSLLLSFSLSLKFERLMMLQKWE